jgi:hypothetical protein
MLQCIVHVSQWTIEDESNITINPPQQTNYRKKVQAN